MTMTKDVYDTLEGLVLCFGTGPESEEYWEGWVDATACDCVNPDHPHNEAAIRDYVLQRARVLLAAHVGAPLATTHTLAVAAPMALGGATPSPDSIEAVSITRLNNYEAVEAAAVFYSLNRQGDPYALTRTIEHVLKMRAQDL